MAATNNKQKEEMAYYMMSMPDWFIDLSTEKKVELAKGFTINSSSDKVMTKEEILNLAEDS